MQPSLWYKSSVKALPSDPARMAEAENDPARTAAEQLSLEGTIRDCSVTLSSNHVDSHTPNDVAEHSAALSTKGCSALPTNMVPKGHDCPAQSGVPKISSSADAKSRPDSLSSNHVDSHVPNAVAEHSTALTSKGCSAFPTGMVPKGLDCPAQSSLPKNSTSASAKSPGFQGVELKCRASPSRQVMSLGNSASRCARYQDPVVTRMPPVSHNGLLRMTSGMSASPGMEVCNSVAPTTGLPGCASLPRINNTSKSHGIMAPGFAPSPKGSESVLPSLALGNSKDVGAECLSSAPVTPGGQEFLSLSIASQNPVPLSVKGPDGSASAARPPLYAPGKPFYTINNFNSSPWETCVVTEDRLLPTKS